MEYILRTTQLTKTFGNHMAVNDVSMSVKKGSIYGFIGKNGAGKSTFMRMVTGLYAPTKGSIELFGSKELDKQRKRIGSIIEQPGIYPNMSAYENLETIRKVMGIAKTGVTEEMLSFVGLEDAKRKKAKNFSMGMKQRLGIAIALLGNPDFLILDEPINGLDPSGIKEVRDLLLHLNKEKEITILISSHILGELSKLASCYGIIKDGALIEEFNKDELEQRCRRCQKIIVDDVGKAVEILERNLHIKSYDVLPDNCIRIFDMIEEPYQINKSLIDGGVLLMESYKVGQDLEGYFMHLLGGAENE